MFYCWTALKAIIFISSPFAKLEEAAGSPLFPLPVPVELLMSKRGCYEFVDDEGEWLKNRPPGGSGKPPRGRAASQLGGRGRRAASAPPRRRAASAPAEERKSPASLPVPNEIADSDPLEQDGELCSYTINSHVDWFVS